MKSKTFYYSSLSDDFGCTENVKKITVDEKYKYNPLRAWSFFWYYIVAKPLAWLITKLLYHYKVVNKKAIKEVKGKPCIIYGNHTNFIADCFICNELRHKKNNIITKRDAVSIKGIKSLVRALGAIPLGDTLKAQKNFMKTIKERLGRGESITIYPEQHIWPYYTKVRPFNDVAMQYSISNDVASYALTTCYQKRKFGNKPKIVAFLDGPFYPDKSLNPKERRIKLTNEIYDIMVKRTKENSTYSIHKYIYKEKEDAKE